MKRVKQQRWDSPFTRFLGDLPLKKIMLISTAGVMQKGQPFEEPKSGFWLIPGNIRAEDLCVPHRYFDHSNIDGDINCIFPIDRLRELISAGRIKGVTDEHVSVYGYHLIQARIKRVVAPQIAEIAEASQSGAVLITAGGLFCHRIAITVQKVVEERGIPTVLITQFPRVTRLSKAPRALYPVGFKPGHAVGPPHQTELQRQVVLDALCLLTELDEPGLVVEKQYPEYSISKS
ncbi:hypothetical protein DRQ11_06280 [candidate division KSB1 bacterium]|nr:MAG: hypothetical protein DRQ11_06280 [candidate division KSB1 bacterium]